MADLLRRPPMFAVIASLCMFALGATTGGALMARPRLLMMDEPSLGLAPLVIEEIFRTIRTLRDAGTTILLVEQNAHQALLVADRAYVMELGRVVLSGAAAELREHELLRRMYLGARAATR